MQGGDQNTLFLFQGRVSTAVLILNRWHTQCANVVIDTRLNMQQRSSRCFVISITASTLVRATQSPVVLLNMFTHEAHFLRRINFRAHNKTWRQQQCKGHLQVTFNAVLELA